jgi:TalC/MipB family fructose-6-phosphate aldolase
MAKEGITGQDNVFKHYRAICDIVGDGRDVSAEVIATDFKGIVEEGKILADLHENIVVKVPMIPDGIKAIAYFTQAGIKTNCTLVFSAGQALLAAKAGATYVSPFIGRIDDIAWEGMTLIKDIFEIYTNSAFETAILAASIRNPLHIVQAAKASNKPVFIVATEDGVSQRLAADCPEKLFITPTRASAICPNMKLTRLENIRNSLLGNNTPIEIAPHLIEPATRCIESMMRVPRGEKVRLNP